MEEREYKKIQIVDENDNFIENVWYEEALARGAIRRAARVMVLNESRQILIQRRSENIAKPLLLDNSVGGHVDEGETYLEAAERELVEELGLSGFQLREIATSFRSGGFFCSLYKVTVPEDVEIKFDEHEVAEILWLTPGELDALLVDSPQDCTHALAHMWTQFRDKILEI